MRTQIEREPFHAERIIMEFRKKTHITDVAFEAVTIAQRTLCDVTLRLDGWEFDVTPHMDVPEIVEAYQKQPGWFVEEIRPVEGAVVSYANAPDALIDRDAPDYWEKQNDQPAA